MISTLLRFLVLPLLLSMPLGLVSCNDVEEIPIRGMAVFVNGIRQESTVNTKITSSENMVDAQAFASVVPDLAFFKMLNPPAPGMVLQYGSTISFAATDFTTGFVSTTQVSMDSPLHVSGDGTYWAPLNFFAKAIDGSIRVTLSVNSIHVTTPLAKKIGDIVPEALDIAKELEDNYDIRQGEISLTSATEMYAAGYLPDCNGNNATNAYLVTQNPISPRAQAFINLPVGMHMDQDEAFVWIGHTPPEVKYFSYQHYLMNRYYSEKNPAIRKVYARLGDSINNYNITTPDSPYNSLFALIICGNQDTYDAISRAIQQSGFPANRVLSLVIPSTVRFGLTLENDALTFLHRATLFTRDSDKTAYLNHLPLEILRVTPKQPADATHMVTPVPRLRQTFVREQDTPGRSALLEQLRTAILEKYSHEYSYTKQLTTSTWMYPGGNQAISDGTNVLGETNDTLYMQTEKFILNEDDLIIVYGINHSETGKSVYSNVSCYGADAFNGVGGITSVPQTADASDRVSYLDSAKEYLPGIGDAIQKELYAYKFSRTYQGDNTYIIPDNQDGSYSGIDNGKTVFMGFRSYVDILTTIGPYPGNVQDGDYFSYQAEGNSEVFFDQAILFTNTDPN